MDQPSRAGMALGAGTALSVLLPKKAGWQAVALVSASSYAASQAMGEETFDVLSVSDLGLDGLGLGKDADEAVRAATGALSWAIASAMVVPVLRALPFPRTLTAVAAGAAVAFANDKAVQRMHELRAADEPASGPASADGPALS